MSTNKQHHHHQTGKYQHDQGASVCIDCASGKYNERIQQASVEACLPCPANSDTDGSGAASIGHC